jgi:hypothetical protein
MTHTLVSDLTEGEARRVAEEIRRRAANPNNVWLSPHAVDQAACREIALLLIHRTLRDGEDAGVRMRLVSDGRPVIRLEWPSKLGRECAVVAALRGQGAVEVVTVMWRDPR